MNQDPLDPKVIEAIEGAVEAAGQPATVSKYLLAWLRSVVNGNEDVYDNQSAFRHLELIYDATQVPQKGN